MRKFLKLLTLSFCFSLLLISSCAQPTHKEQILATKDKVIAALAQGSEDDFRGLIGVPLKVVGKNEEMLQNDFVNLTRLLKGKKSKDVTFIMLEQPNEVGQKVIQIPLVNTSQQMASTKKLILELYFGPPDINALDKLSGYDIISE